MFVCARRGEVVPSVVVHAESGLGADQVRAAVSATRNLSSVCVSLISKFCFVLLCIAKKIVFRYC